MKQSLKSFLLEYLKAQRGAHIAHWSLMLLVKQKGFRESNAERRLREMPEVGKDFENGVIKSYYWKQPSQIPQTHKQEDCPSWLIYKVFCPDCRKLNEAEDTHLEKEIIKLF